MAGVSLPDAAESRITAMPSLDDVVPLLLLPHTAYKSYPEGSVLSGKWTG